MESTPLIKKKVCLLGDGAVGKTSLIRKYVLDIFSDEYLTTIGTKLSKKELFLVYSDDHKDKNITLMIWDIMGQPGFRHVLKDAYFEGTNGAIVVCDFTRRTTLDNLESWIDTMTSIAGEVPMLFLANKSDLAGREFTIDDLKELAGKYKNVRCMETSAKVGDNVDEAFEELAKMMVE